MGREYPPLAQPTHYYQQIADKIRSQIRDGVFVPGGAIPSERKLAQQYGVTQPTVSKALSILMTEGLVHRQIGQGTFVNPDLARSQYVGVVHYDSFDQNPFYTTTVGSIAQALRSSRLSIHPFMIRNKRINHETAPLLYEQVKRGLLSGMVLLDPVAIDDARFFLAQRIPFVTAGFYYPSLLEQVPGVISSEFQTTQHVMQSLISAGCKRIAIICGPQLHEDGFHTDSAEAVAGYRQALLDAGIPEDAELILSTAYTEEAHEATARKVVEFDPRPDAVLCDQRHVPALSAHFERANLKIRADVRVVLMDASHFADEQTPQNQTVPYRRGLWAAESLLDLIQGRPANTPLRMIETTSKEL